MNIKELKEMIALMNENGLTEVEVERDGVKVRLKKGASGIEHEVIQAAPQGATAPAAQAPPEAQAPAPTEPGLVEIKAPMVGTFYRASAPEAPPYAEVGQDIDEGQVVCIIEAMKLMNEIKSEVSGKVAKILVDNANPVEYGKVLFLIEPRT